MRRTGIAIATIACASAVLAGPASAGLGNPFNNQYEGRAPKADTSSYLGFDVKKKRGAQRVSKVKTMMAFSCQNGGPEDLYLPIFGKGAIKVKPTGKFKGSVKAAFPAAIADKVPVRFKKGSKITLSGKLGKGKLVKGSVNSVIKLAPIAPPRGGATSLNCSTGATKYEVKRGADVTPLPPEVTREALGV